MVSRRTGEALGIGIVERQRVQGEVVGLERQRGRKRRLEPLEGLSGRVVQEVEIDRLNSGIARSANRGLDVLNAMATAEPPQLGIVERLGPIRDPGDPGMPQGVGIAALIRPGVGLEGDLGPIGDSVSSADEFDQPGDVLGGQE